VIWDVKPREFSTVAVIGKNGDYKFDPVVHWISYQTEEEFTQPRLHSVEQSWYTQNIFGSAIDKARLRLTGYSEDGCIFGRDLESYFVADFGPGAVTVTKSGSHPPVDIDNNRPQRASTSANLEYEIKYRLPIIALDKDLSSNTEMFELSGGRKMRILNVELYADGTGWGEVIKP
jgi:hypothetical protein